MVFFIDEARSRPPVPRLLTNVNKKMVFFIEGFPNRHFSLTALGAFNREKALLLNVKIIAKLRGQL